MKSDNNISSLHVIGSRSLGGAERFYARLVNAFHDKHYNVMTCLPFSSDIRQELHKDVPNNSALMLNVHDPISKYSVARIIKKTAPDIVQTYMGRATRLVNLENKKGAVHIARLGGYYNLKGYRHAHAWVGNTKGICDYLVKEGLPSDRVFHISNFIDIPSSYSDQEKLDFRNKHNIPDTAFLVSAVGRLHPNKGFSDLLQAFSKLITKDQSIYLAIAGDGPLRNQLLKETEELGLSNCVRWLGWLSPPDLLYQASDVFVCPSVHEPLGNVILESWAQQVPIISTRSAGALELIDQDVNGILVDVGDASALASSLSEFQKISDQDRKSLVNHGLEKLKTLFSRDVIVNQYQELYGLLLRS